MLVFIVVLSEGSEGHGHTVVVSGLSLNSLNLLMILCTVEGEISKSLQLLVKEHYF